MYFQGSFDYERYPEVTDRIMKFDRVKNIGKDESGNYDMYSIELGAIGKPAILITAGVHGQETQSTQYSLHFMEWLRDDDFPDKVFRDYLLENFLIVYIPVLNPWGMDNIPDYLIRANSRHYENSNGVDINRDFQRQTQQETKNVIGVMDGYDYFSHLDCHLMVPGYGMVDHQNFVVANERPESRHIQERMAKDWESLVNEDVMRWDIQPERHHMVRGYSLNKSNSHTPFTLPMMTEIMRPVNWNGRFTEYLTNEEIFHAGFSALYTFFKNSMLFYEESQEKMIPEIPEIPDDLDSGLFVSRNRDGLTETITKRRNGKDTISLFMRNIDGYVTRVETEIKEI